MVKKKSTKGTPNVEEKKLKAVDTLVETPSKKKPKKEKTPKTSSPIKSEKPKEIEKVTPSKPSPAKVDKKNTGSAKKNGSSNGTKKTPVKNIPISSEVEEKEDEESEDEIEEKEEDSEDEENDIEAQEQNNPKNKPMNGSYNKTLYVANIPSGTNEEQLRTHFSQFGETPEVELPKNFENLVKGFAFVKFKSEDNFLKALNHDGQKIKNTVLNIKVYSGLSKNRDRILFVGRLSPETTEKQLEELFKQFGNISKIRLPQDDDSDKIKGYAHITFDDPKSVFNALKERNIKMGDQTLLLGPSVQKKKRKSLNNNKGNPKKIKSS